MKFMDDKVFLTNDTAVELYNACKSDPIYDYHCHLSPEEIYNDKVFNDLTELWLMGDHYKWRVMRAYGIDEDFVTGKADNKSKFFAFCKSLPSFIGNPVYHWAHMELKKYFGITLPICEKNAEFIWNETKQMMSDGKYSAQKLIRQSGVDTLVTTDNPCDDLRYHKLIKESNLGFNVLPCFRPDKAVNIENDIFVSYVNSLALAAGKEINSLSDLIDVLKVRLDYFTDNGCLSSDISFTDFPIAEYDEYKANEVFVKVMRGEQLTIEEVATYKFCILVKLGELLKNKNCVLLLHTGVIRNCNTKLFRKVGVDAGGDSVADPISIIGARNLLDKIELTCGLPKTVIYTLNPTAYYPLSTLIADFQSGTKGKLQLGAAWWLADHRDGIIEQLRHVAFTGGLGLFIGMLTDSRSFTSYARHDYFRRILCSVIGEYVEGGEYGADEEELARLIHDISFNNAKNYFENK